MYKKHLISFIIHLAAIAALAFAAFYIPKMFNHMKVDINAELYTLTNSVSKADCLVDDMTAIHETNAEILAQLAEYDNVYINKDIFLHELSDITNQTGVILTRFAEEISEQNQIPKSLTAISFSVTLYGNNKALYDAFDSIMNLSETSRIIDVSLVSDSLINILPKVPSKSTLLEALANTQLLESYKLTGTQFIEMSTLSFTIEFLFRNDELDINDRGVS